VTLAADHLTTDTTFDELGVSAELVTALIDQGIEHPFPIQALTLPDALAGRDVCGKAKTGSGKTLAFGLPMAQLLGRAEPRRPHGLVLVPTRELALQVSRTIRPLVAARGHSLVTVYGGSSIKEQIDALARGVEIVVATPGRLIDLSERGAIDLGAVSIVVIDEADEMADMGFLPQVTMVLSQVTAPHQTLLFSATLDIRVTSLVEGFMDDPEFHEVESGTVTVETSHHRFLEVHHMDKAKVAARILRSAGRGLVFVQTKRGCDRVAKDLRDLGIGARAIHGDLQQEKRERALAAFTDGKAPVLVATNVAARGIHVEGVDVVIHFDAPGDSKTYLHRSGRTARAGEAGLVVTLVEWDQTITVRQIQREAGLLQPIEKMFSTDDRLDDLSAWEPEPEPEPKKRPGRRSARSRRRNRLL
jgi:superfamily II DNA/RNA helicase